MPAARPRNRGRRPAHREPRTTFLVVCGGQETEIQYVDHLKETLRLQSVTIKHRGKGSSPDQLVREASQETDSFDQVWVVCDVDNYQVQVVKAATEARRAGVNTAVSNPCFEVWLVWHRETNNSGMTIKQAQERASFLGLTHGKNDKVLRKSEIRGRFEEARLRAQSARAAHARNSLILPDNVPSSDVDLLVDAILAAEGASAGSL